MKIIKTFESITKTIDTFNENGTYKIYFFVYHKRTKKISKDILRIILAGLPAMLWVMLGPKQRLVVPCVPRGHDPKQYET
jgi:hypothetical protein